MTNRHINKLQAEHLFTDIPTEQDYRRAERLQAYREDWARIHHDRDNKYPFTPIYIQKQEEEIMRQEIAYDAAQRKKYEARAPQPPHWAKELLHRITQHALPHRITQRPPLITIRTMGTQNETHHHFLYLHYEPDPKTKKYFYKVEYMILNTSEYSITTPASNKYKSRPKATQQFLSLLKTDLLPALKK